MARADRDLKTLTEALWLALEEQLHGMGVVVKREH